MEPSVVAVLEVMWDWETLTSSAGSVKRSPGYYSINPKNFTGNRLYKWLGHHRLWVTNACPELVRSAQDRGTPDPTWLANNLATLSRYYNPHLLLVCGRVAQATYAETQQQLTLDIRTLYLPHPAARTWTKTALASARQFIRKGKQSLHLTIKDGRLVARKL